MESEFSLKDLEIKIRTNLKGSMFDINFIEWPIKKISILELEYEFFS